MKRIIPSAVLIFILAASPVLAAETAPKAKPPAKKPVKTEPAVSNDKVVEKESIPPPAVSTPEEKTTLDNTAEKTPVPASKHSPKDKFYVDLGAPLLFNYNTPATGSSANPNSATPNGTWTGGMAIGVGFEKAISAHISTFLDMGLVTMDVNQLLFFNYGPTKTAGTFLNALIGLKVNMLPEKPVSPYISGGLGVSSMSIDEMTTNNLFFYDDIPEYRQARFLTRGALGLDIRCDDDLTAYVEFQFYDMDTLHIFSPTPDADLVLFKSGLRMAL